MMKWEDAQDFEREWWGNPVNSFHEEEKQLHLAPLLGLKLTETPKTPYNIDCQGAKILDIGGGPTSLLLKCVNFKEAFVVDPLMYAYPDWVKERYKSAGIQTFSMLGEDIKMEGFDEVWIYNVLQHTKTPLRVIRNAQKAGRFIRLFEWIDTPVSPGHIHTLTESNLNKWLRGEGKVTNLSEHGLYGRAYSGVFLGDSFAKKAEK